MIEPATGKIVLDDGAAAIEPGLTRKAFVASDLGKKAELSVAAGDWYLYFAGVHRVGGEAFAIGLHFRRTTLANVYLNLIVEDPHGNDGAASVWTRALKHAAKPASKKSGPPADDPFTIAHTLWLAAQLGVKRLPRRGLLERSFAWGSVGSYWDFKNGETSIVVDYGDPEAP